MYTTWLSVVVGERGRYCSGRLSGTSLWEAVHIIRNQAKPYDHTDRSVAPLYTIMRHPPYYGKSADRNKKGWMETEKKKIGMKGWKEKRRNDRRKEITKE